MSRILVLIVALVAVAPVQDARAEYVTVDLECHNGTQFTQSVTCLPGQEVTINYNCKGESGQTRKFMCPGIIGNWGLSLGGFYLDATRTTGGPSMAGVELQFSGHLRVRRDWLWFSFGIAPGAVSNGDSKLFALSDFAAADFRPWRWMSIKVVVRHRGAFGSEGGSLNGLLSEVGLDLTLQSGLTFGAFGSAGVSWFPITTEISEYNPHSQQVETITVQETGLGFLWAAGLSAGWTFF